jgi:hypothetical protein
MPKGVEHHWDGDDQKVSGQNKGERISDAERR